CIILWLLAEDKAEKAFHHAWCTSPVNQCRAINVNALLVGQYVERRAVFERFRIAHGRIVTLLKAIRFKSPAIESHQRCAAWLPVTCLCAAHTFDFWLVQPRCLYQLTAHKRVHQGRSSQPWTCFIQYACTS